MNTYYFVGSQSEIAGRKLDRLGQPVELSDEAFSEAVEGGAALVTKDELDLQFKPDELKMYAYPGQRLAAPTEIQMKLVSLQKVAAARCHAVRCGETIPVADHSLFSQAPEGGHEVNG